MNLKLLISMFMVQMLASLFVEAAVVGVVCIIFLLLFVVAGIKQLLNDKD